LYFFSANIIQKQQSGSRLFAFYLDSPAVGTTDLVDVKQAKAKAFNVVHVAGWYAVELLKQSVLVFFAYARPFVGNVEV